MGSLAFKSCHWPALRPCSLKPDASATWHSLYRSKSSYYIVNASKCLIRWNQDSGAPSKAGEGRSTQCMKRSLLVADTQCVLGISQSMCPNERRASLVLAAWLSGRQWPELPLWLLVTVNTTKTNTAPHLSLCLHYPAQSRSLNK